MGKFCTVTPEELGKQEAHLLEQCEYREYEVRHSCISASYFCEVVVPNQLGCPDQQQGDETTGDECWLAPTTMVTSFSLGNAGTTQCESSS